MSNIAGLLREIVSDYNCGDKVITTDKARVIRDAAREIERLTPKEMTLEEACEVLTESEIGVRSSRWVEDGYGNAICHDVDDDPRYRQDSLTERQAVFVAQGFIREKEAGL
jgi:hypothetical protein